MSSRFRLTLGRLHHPLTSLNSPGLQNATMAHLHADISALISTSQIYSLLPTCFSPPLPTAALGTRTDSSSCVQEHACYTFILSPDPFSHHCHSKSSDSLQAHPDLTTFCLLCSSPSHPFLPWHQESCLVSLSNPHPFLASPLCSSHTPSEERPGLSQLTTVHQLLWLSEPKVRRIHHDLQAPCDLVHSFLLTSVSISPPSQLFCAWPQCAYVPLTCFPLAIPHFSNLKKGTYYRTPTWLVMFPTEF